MTLFAKITSKLTAREHAMFDAMTAHFADIVDLDIAVALMEARYIFAVTFASDDRSASLLREAFPELKTNFDRIDEARKP